MVLFLLSCMPIGNHEYYSGDVDRWIEKLPELHVKPLINDRTCILSMKGSRSSIRNNSSCYNGFYLAGLEDIETRRLRYAMHFCGHDKNSVFSQK